MKSSISFKDLTKELNSSLLEILHNGKTWFGFLLLVVILAAIWSNAMNVEWYNSAHGVQTSTDYRTQAVFFMFLATTLAVIIFVSSLIKQILKQLKFKK